MNLRLKPNAKLQIWDLGQPRFRTIHSSYYRGAHGIFIMFDISDRESWENIKNWLQDIERYACESVTKIVVGCNADLAMRRAVPLSEIKTFCDERELVYCEASAKTGRRVINAVGVLTEQVWSRISTKMHFPTPVLAHVENSFSK